MRISTYCTKKEFEDLENKLFKYCKKYEKANKLFPFVGKPSNRINLYLKGDVVLSYAIEPSNTYEEFELSCRIFINGKKHNIEYDLFDYDNLPNPEEWLNMVLNYEIGVSRVEKLISLSLSKVMFKYGANKENTYGYDYSSYMNSTNTYKLNLAFFSINPYKNIFKIKDMNVRSNVERKLIQIQFRRYYFSIEYIEHFEKYLEEIIKPYF